MNTTKNTLILACAVVAVCATPGVKADFTFGEPRCLGPTVNSPLFENIDCISSDGLEMYVDVYEREGGYGDMDLWVLKRASVDEDWGPPENLGATVNSPQEDCLASISADGLTLYFTSICPGGVGDYDMYMATRASRNDPWGQAVNLGSPINSTTTDGEPWISSTGLELFFESYRSGGYGKSDIYVVRRQTEKEPWSPPINLGSTVNSASRDQMLSLSPDGLLLLFSDHPWIGDPRPGGYGASDMWMTRRASLSAPWQTPVNLGPKVNGQSVEYGPRISPDGCVLYFGSNRPGGPGPDWGDIWQAPILPIVDLDGDGKVNDQDVAMMMEHWGQADPRCDIAPMPWGDGIVNDEDLKVLLKHALDPISGTVEVPLNVVLSWVPPQFAESYDVYLGTSSVDVGKATRDDPRGVLVSQGQTQTTYDPEGVLEFSETYYWRIDVVGPAPDFTVDRGLVLSFTTEAFSYPIRNVIAAASSFMPGMSFERTVDGSGLDENDGHSTDGNAMWFSTTAKPHWIQFAFDQIYTLHELWVWNSNQAIEPILGFGAKTVKVEYSIDGATWTMLEAVPEFARAPGESAYKPNTTVSFGGVLAKYVKLTIEANWGGLPQTGLAEVRFFYIPDRFWATTP